MVRQAHHERLNLTALAPREGSSKFAPGELVHGKAAEACLLGFARYIVLNPVRAGMVVQPGDWPWSSYRAVTGLESSPTWLETDGVLAWFGEERSIAGRRFVKFVMAGLNVAPLPRPSTRSHPPMPATIERWPPRIPTSKPKPIFNSLIGKPLA